MNAPKIIFLDTEFTNFIDTTLVSMGMVTDTGEQFYVEVPYPDDECSAFVREVVVPRLGRMPWTFSTRPNLPHRILQWLEVVREPGQCISIAFDYQADWDLFVDTIESRLPEWCGQKRATHLSDPARRAEFYRQHRLSEHHALNDARALRHACQINLQDEAS